MSFILLSFSHVLIAQQEYSAQLITFNAPSEKATDWTTYIDNELFQIEYVFANCDPNVGFDYEGVMLKITNKTSSKLQLSWHKILHYAGTCRTCDYPEEYSFSLSLAPNEVLEADCDPQTGYDLKFFSRFIDAQYSQGDQLTSFQLLNLTATQY